MAENNAEATEQAPSAASVMAKEYTPRTTAGEAKGLAELGYDRQGYISQIDPASFTAPIEELATSDLPITKEAAVYAAQRKVFRDKQIAAQMDKAWGNMSTNDKNLMDDMYVFSKFEGNKGDFYRQMFDLSGRMTNRQVSEAATAKLNSYDSLDAFNSDAKNSGLFKENDRNVGMLYGWGEDMEGDISSYQRSKTYGARQAEIRRAMLADMKSAREGRYDPRGGQGGGHDSGFGTGGSSFRSSTRDYNKAQKSMGWGSAAASEFASDVATTAGYASKGYGIGSIAGPLGGIVGGLIGGIYGATQSFGRSSWSKSPWGGGGGHSGMGPGGDSRSGGFGGAGTGSHSGFGGGGGSGMGSPGSEGGRGK